MSGPPALRDYQLRALDEIRAHIRAGTRKILLVSPTGSGKTTIAAAMIQGAAQRGKRILFIAHRRELINQCCDRLAALGVEHGVILAGDSRVNPQSPVQVGSIQTLIRRSRSFEPELIFIDEAHHARAESYTKIVEQFPESILIGLTATPIRSDGRGLGNLFDAMVTCSTITELTERGFLVPAITYTQPRQAIDLTGVRKTGGDFQLDQLASRVNQPKLIGNIVSHWRVYAANRQTIAFAVNVEHSQAICAQFKSYGIRAEHLDGSTPQDTREAILRRLSNRETQIIINCQVLTEGFDCPPVSCVILARPTASLGLYLQMAGRALRPFPGKANCIILDHAGCVHMHGLCSYPHEWQLTTTSATKPAHVDISDTYKVCPECGSATARAVPVCHCGYQFTRAQIEIKHDVSKGLVQAPPDYAAILNDDAKRSFYRKKLWLARYERTKQGKRFHPRFPEMIFLRTFGRPPQSVWRHEFLSACAACEAAGLKPYVDFDARRVEAVAKSLPFSSHRGSVQ